MSPTNDSTESETVAQLPAPEQGVTLLETDSTADSAIHALAVDYLLRSGGEALWIDTGAYARTDPLVELAPSARLLDRVRVARGFTPFQHLELLRSLPAMVSDRTELLLVTDLDRYYRGEDLLGNEGQEMLLAGVAAIASAVRREDLTVLVTRAEADEFSEPIETAASNTLHCEGTPFGPRFRAGDEQTLVYPTNGGQWTQTTLAFWSDILAAREPLYEHSSVGMTAKQGVTVRGAN